MAVLGIDIGGTSVKIAVLKNETEIIDRAHCVSVAGDPEMMADRICTAARPLIERYGIDRVGISCPGTIDAHGCSIADNLRWRDAPIRSLIADRLSLPVAIENDGSCALIAERQYGALRGLSHAVYLMLGTGIGGGVIAGNHAVKGKKGENPELGHMITHVGGLSCACGANGCFEVYASASAFARLSGWEAARQGIEAAKRGDKAALSVWHTYLHELATGLIGLMSIFFPRAIVLGGGLSNAGDFLLSGVKDALRKIPAYGVRYSDVEVRLSRFQNDAGVIGAATIARDPRAAGYYTRQC